MSVLGNSLCLFSVVRSCCTFMLFEFGYLRVLYKYSVLLACWSHSGAFMMYDFALYMYCTRPLCFVHDPTELVLPRKMVSMQIVDIVVSFSSQLAFLGFQIYSSAV